MNNRFNWRRWIGRIAIPNLMNYVVGAMAVVFVVQMLIPRVNLYGMLMLTCSGLMRGELWRLVTFAFLPPNSSVMWIVFSLYFYWMIGSALESAWGSSRFTLFYLVGMLGSIISAWLVGYSDNTYLNLSLFLAYAVLNPNHQFMIFFLLPVKVKYLAILDVALYTVAFITGSWATRITIIFSLLNLILFLGGDFINTFRKEARYFETRRNFKKAMRGR